MTKWIAVVVALLAGLGILLAPAPTGPAEPPAPPPDLSVAWEEMADADFPLYINSEASLPLIRALLDGGMSQGAAMSFMISGAGTSIGAIAGALTIARSRVIALVVGVLWIGAMVSGFAFDLALTLQLF